MLLLALASAVAGVSPQPLLAEARHAVEAGRIEQSRLLIARAVAAGAAGPDVERALADVAFTSGNFGEAAARYASLARSAGGDTAVMERAGIAALKSGNLRRATTWVTNATARDDASWRAWNALGVLADIRGDYAAADAAYARGLEISPTSAMIANNKGWSLLLRGAWDEAVVVLEQAAALESAPTRIRNNLELARAALDQDLPRRRSGEDDESWAARLNDAGVVAQLNGQNARAIAAFAQAIEARSVWFKRAAENLRAAEASQ